MLEKIIVRKVRNQQWKNTSAELSIKSSKGARRGVRKCIFHNFQLLLLVPFEINRLHLKRKKQKASVNIHSFRESAFTTAVVFHNSRRGRKGSFRNCKLW